MLAANSNESELLVRRMSPDRITVAFPNILGPIPGPDTLHHIRSIQTGICENDGRAPAWLSFQPMSSRKCYQGINSLEGIVEGKEHERLSYYAQNCIDLLLFNVKGLGPKTITIGVLDGLTSDFSFAVAASCDLIVATKGSQCILNASRTGIPSTPGLLAILERRVGRSIAKSLLSRQTAINVEDLFDLGLVAMISKGSVQTALDAIINLHHASHTSIINTRNAINRSCMLPLDIEETGEDWSGQFSDPAVSAALSALANDKSMLRRFMTS